MRSININTHFDETEVNAAWHFRLPGLSLSFRFTPSPPFLPPPPLFCRLVVGVIASASFGALGLYIHYETSVLQRRQPYGRPPDPSGRGQERAAGEQEKQRPQQQQQPSTRREAMIVESGGGGGGGGRRARKAVYLV